MEYHIPFRPIQNYRFGLVYFFVLGVPAVPASVLAQNTSWYTQKPVNHAVYNVFCTGCTSCTSYYYITYIFPKKLNLILN